MRLAIDLIKQHTNLRVDDWEIVESLMKEFAKLHVEAALTAILNDYNDELVKLTKQIESLEKKYDNLSHLKIKELNIIRGKKSQLVECIKIIKHK
jgi:hypothetical protein